MRLTCITDLKIIQTESELDRHYKPGGLTLELPELKDKTVKKVLDELPLREPGEKYSYDLHLLYKGTYISMYYLYKELRFGSGTLELCKELRDEFLKHQK